MVSKIRTNYLPELAALVFGRSKPSVVAVNLTSRCNQRCIYCEIGKNIPSPQKDTLTFDDIKWIIDQMAIIKIPKISFCGGEPFLFEGIIEIVAYAKKNNIRCTITTNGMTAYKLNENELNILKNCKTEINVSVDSFKESVQSFTRGTSGSLPNVFKSIEILSQKNIPVTILTAISKYNYFELSDFFQEAYERGIKQVLFQPIIYYSNYPDRPTIDEKSKLNVGIDKLDALMDELRNILQFEKKHPINTNVYRIMPWIEHYLRTAENQNRNWFFDDVLDKFFCRELYAIIDITYDGGIQPCGLSLATINIHENRQLGLMALWTEATASIKKDLLNGNYHPYCNGCCHHFSRNMLASIFKHPVQNRRTLFSMMPLLFLRVYSRIIKKMKKSIT